MTLNEEIVMFCAFRYALGRRTYVVGAIVAELQRRYNDFHETERAKYVKEIQEHQDTWGLTGYVDDRAWNKIKWLFDSNRKRTIEANFHQTTKWKTVEAILGDDGKYYSIPEMLEYHTVRNVE